MARRRNSVAAVDCAPPPRHAGRPYEAHPTATLWRLHCRAGASATPSSPPRRRRCDAAVAPTWSRSCCRAAAAAAALALLTRFRHRCGRAVFARACPARATTEEVHAIVASPNGI